MSDSADFGPAPGRALAADAPGAGAAALITGAAHALPAGTEGSAP